jgi:serine/threonine protein kinase/Tol biopolymer transport system component
MRELIVCSNIGKSNSAEAVMTPNRWQEIERVYHAALQCPPTGRAAFLAEACKNDPELSREVESLLAQDSSKTGPLDRPAWAGLASSAGGDVTVIAPGTQLGPYRIEGPLGAGGMGEVFRATDTRLHRTVAIKFLPRDKVADPEHKRRLLQEARAASALNHPNIVALHDIANDNGVDYLVMEYVPGKSLDKLITPKGLPLAEALNYAQQIANGLAAAHAAGIVHRDMKPGNVIVTSESQVKILDFGLAKLVERAPGAEGETQTQESVLTKAGTVMGTVAYMSPEQASAKTLDHRTDIFSFGVMLYEMLAGKRPFRGRSHVETMHAIINDPAPPLVARPAELQEILDKALAKDPKERYQHAGDFGLDLRRFERKPARAMQVPSERAPSRLLPAAILVLLLAVPAAWWLGRRGTSPTIENPLNGAKFTRFTDFPGDEVEAAISPDGKFVAFLSDRDGPVDLFVSQVGTSRFTNLTQGKEPDLRQTVRSPGFSSDGSEIWYRGTGQKRRPKLVPLMGGTPRLFMGEHVPYMAWSPDGARMVYHTNDDGDPIFVGDRTGADARQILKGGHNHDQTWSPDGKWIYFAKGIDDPTDIWRMAPSGGEPERLTQHNARADSPAPIDNHTVLYRALDQDGAGPWLWALDVDRKVTRRVSFGLEQFTSISASRDGRRVVAAVSSPTASLWSLPILDRVAEEKDAKAFPVGMVRALTPRYGGQDLFYLSSRGTGDGLWRYHDGQALEIWKGADGALSDPPAVSGDGGRVAVILRKNGALHLQVGNADGTDFHTIGDAIHILGSASLSPDGKWVVVGGNDDKGPGIYKIPADGAAPVRIFAGKGRDPVWSPDGQVIVFVSGFIGSVNPIRAVRPDGAPVDLPEISISTNGERARFLPDSKGLVYMQGGQGSQDFWLLDLRTKKSRHLAHLENIATMRTFDITPDGKQIVFDRLRENSDIVLIDLPERNK